MHPPLSPTRRGISTCNLSAYNQRGGTEKPMSREIENYIKMKKLFTIIICSILFSSCATIVGGSRYYAKVDVPGYPNAKVELNGIPAGKTGFKVQRNVADRVSISVTENGCETQITKFHRKTFRGWALTGTILGWTGIIGGIPIPWGCVVDASTGAWWKPNVNEKGVTKQDYKHFTYQINYTGCANVKKDEVSKISKGDRLRELKQLLDDGVLTQEEFDKEKKKILLEK